MKVEQGRLGTSACHYCSLKEIVGISIPCCLYVFPVEVAAVLLKYVYGLLKKSRLKHSDASILLVDVTTAVT